jgi:transcriptional regulator with XRE-family HTH domain
MAIRGYYHHIISDRNNKIKSMRPRTKSLRPSQLSDAVRELRLHLQNTQQAFAAKVGTAITTIARYETDRTPRGKVLLQFARLAEEAGRTDLGRLFRSALAEDLGLSVGAVVGARREQARVRTEVDRLIGTVRQLCAGFHGSDLSKAELAALGREVESAVLTGLEQIAASPRLPPRPSPTQS